MLKEFLEEVVVMTVGKGTEPIAELLNSNKYVNEFNIAKKLGITINQTRNILYKISDYGLVSFERKKDKKKGWYTYYWRFEIMKCLEFLKRHLLERREQFSNQIQRREEKNYYVCEYCNIECSEDEALLQEFTCDECGELFTQKDNTTLLKGLKKNLEKIDEKLALINVEIENEQKKIDKKKMASLRAEEEEKERKKEEAKKKRDEKRKEREALKKAEKEKRGEVKKVKEKKVSKKVVKKTEKKVGKKVVPKKEKKVSKNKVEKKQKKSLKVVAKKKAVKKKK